MHTAPRPAILLRGRRISRSRLLLYLFAGIAAMLTLAACGQVDNSTEISSDGSGVQTLSVVISESDMESIDGGVATIESTIEAKNPGLSYEGSSKDGTDTIFTFTLDFANADDYAAKVQPILEAGELTKTAEATFTPPSPPFSSGYTLTRNVTANDLTRWAVKALVDSGKIADAADGDIDNALEQGEVTVSVDGSELDQDRFASADSAAVWSNSETVGFQSVEVATAGADDPSADSYTRTLTYELERATYLDAKEEFDAFFADATPEGGELTPAAKTGTTWVLTFPAGTAEEVGTWTDTALATSGSTFSVESAPNSEDPFALETRVVDDIDCTVACGQTGDLSQALTVPAGFSGGSADSSDSSDAADDDSTEEIALEGGPEPQVITRNIGFQQAEYDLTVNRDGGGILTMALSLPAADDALVTKENVIAFLGEGTERTEQDDVVTYTRTAEAETAEEFPGALQKLGFVGAEGPPQVNVHEQGDGMYSVTLVMGADGELYDKLGPDATWTIRGDGLRPTSVTSDEMGNASLGEETITAKGEHGLFLTFSAERTGLGIGAIVAIVVGVAVLGLLIAAAVIAFLYRGKIAALLRGTSDRAPVAAAAPFAGSPSQAGQAPGDGGPQGTGGNAAPAEGWNHTPGVDGDQNPPTSSSP